MERGNMMHGTAARENLKAYNRTTGNFPFGILANEKRDIWVLTIGNL